MLSTRLHLGLLSLFLERGAASAHAAAVAGAAAGAVGAAVGAAGAAGYAVLHTDVSDGMVS